MLKATLGKWGYDVVCASDGDEAWEVLNGEDPPRLAILDWLMPGRSGVEVCRELRALSRRHYTYVILLTSRHRTDDLVEGLDAGADDYITKPFETKELRARLRAAKRIGDLHASLLTARDDLAALNASLEKRVEKRTEDVFRLLAQKDQFVRQLGHDLRTPLTPLVALLPLIAERTDDPQAAEMLELVLDNVEYIRNLVDKTLELARLNESVTMLDLTPVDLHAEVHDMIVRLDLDIQNAGVRVVQDLPPRLRVIADRLLLRQVLQNVLLNAVRFAGDGGTITIDSKPGEGDVDDMVVLSVHDNGAGMTRDELSHVFEEFYKADESRHERQSPGLGLSICKRIIESHGGRIWLESDGPGRGTTARVALPVSTTCKDLQGPHRRATSLGRRQGGKLGPNHERKRNDR